MALTSEGRVLKMWMLGVMLQKLSKLYPHFANSVYWHDANILLAEFCLPEEERNVVDKSGFDEFYVQAIALHLNIPYHEVLEGFQLASQSQES